MPHMYDDVIIDLTIDEPSRSSPALGQLDKLLRQSALETQSLQVVRRMLLRDMLDRAQVTGVTKLSAAAKQRQLLATNGNGAEPAWSEEPATPKKSHKKKKKYSVRQPKEARLAAIRHYLELHPGSDSHALAAGLGWRYNQVHKFAHLVGESRQQGHKMPKVWFPKNSGTRHLDKPKTKTEKTAAAPAINGHPAKIARQPRELRQVEMRRFLTKKPESYTSEVAAALKLRPNSSFVKILRTVARPLHPTKGTQPIQWVLTA